MSDERPLAVADAQAGEALPGLTLRALVLAVIFIAVGSLWVMKVSLISHTCQVSEGVPSVPALMFLMLLTGLVLLLKYRHATVRQELLVIYVMLSLGVSLSSDNVMRQLFPALTSARYFAAPDNDYGLFADQLPPWLAISDEKTAREFCEGSDHGIVPWRVWLWPLVTWGGVFVGFSLGLYCLFALFRRPWADHEHLSFPLVQLALDIAPGGGRPADATGHVPAGGRGARVLNGGHTHDARQAGTPVLRDRHVLGLPLFWIGFSLGVLFNASNIAHAFSPQLPAFGSGFDLGTLLNQPPWTGMRPLYLAFRPEIVGLGYMVPLDILLSAWVFYLVLRFENFTAQLLGFSIAGFPFDEPQAHGAYLGLAAMLVYSARRHLGDVVRAAFGAVASAPYAPLSRDTSPGEEGGTATADEGEALPYRVAFWGIVAVFVGLVAWCCAAGMTTGISVVYVGLSFVTALVYGRIRAQTGLPISYIVPRRDVYQVIYDWWPSPGRFSSQRLRTESAFALLTVVNRMIFAQLGAFEMEGLRIADLGRVRRGHMLSAVAIALVVGTLMGYWTHLSAAYEYGNNILDGGTTVGGWRTRQAVMQLEELQTRATTATPVVVNANVARGVGLLVTVGMLVVRARILRFPLHPMGLAIAASFGYHTWFPIFVVWLIKALVLRLGGARLVRQLTAGFLGLAVGHMLTAGGVWGLVGAVDEDVARRYLVWFT